jgi:hypothetical protein
LFNAACQSPLPFPPTIASPAEPDAAASGKRFLCGYASVNEMALEHSRRVPAIEFLLSTSRGLWKIDWIGRIRWFACQAVVLWKKWLGRRHGGGTAFHWTRLNAILKRHPLPPARIVHRLYANASETPVRLLRAPSLWFVIALIALMILEIPRTTGGPLEKAGAELVAGWLGQLVFLSLIFDALRGTLPRAVALIPVIFYSSYYIAYWEQGVHIRLKSDELRAKNPGMIVAFDPGKYSLATDQADIFAASHSVPVVYARDLSYFPDGYVSYRLIAKSNMKDLSKEKVTDAQILSVYWNGVKQSNVVEIRIPETPPHGVISVSVNDDAGEGWKDWNIGSRTTSLVVEGRVIGAFKSAYVRRLPIAPFFTIGCRFSAEPPKRSCQAEFRTEELPIESRPDSVDRTLYDEPVSIMLGIKALSKKDMTEFRGFSADAGIGALLRSAPDEEAAFEALREIIDGRSPTLSWAMSFLIADDPSRLAPLAAGMVKRFLELSQNVKIDVPDRSGQARLLASGIVALRLTEFAAVQDQLTDLARKASTRDEYPLLYLRLADAGSKVFSIYRDQFLAQNATQPERLLAALAICRIGQADNELIAGIKSEWNESNTGEATDQNYKTALFVALLKLGQENMLKNTMRTNSRVLQSWYDAVLGGRGKTNAGPNNCMPMEWPGSSYVPAVLAPSLRWSREQWGLGN